jgi:hypothetical protein
VNEEYSVLDREIRLKELEVELERLKLERDKLRLMPVEYTLEVTSIQLPARKKKKKPNLPGRVTTARFLAVLSIDIEKTHEDIATELGTSTSYSRRTLVNLHRKNLVTRRLENNRYFYCRDRGQSC